jgi:N-acetylglucosamine malate deacetylase 1
VHLCKAEPAARLDTAGVAGPVPSRPPDTRRIAMSDRPLNVLCFGAHPDDCDFRYGGMALLWRGLGHRVKFVSLTNGDTGHHAMGGGELARRRWAEAQASGCVADVEYEVLDIHNGELEPTVMVRKLVIERMRRFAADLVLCHRANDYHPDHRSVGVLVQDAAYIVTVPNVCPLTPPLPRPPVLGYAFDEFALPNPYRIDVAIDTDPVFERKVDMLHCHASQMYEWLPFNGEYLEEVPADDARRRAWLGQRQRRRFGHVADVAREALQRCYGDQAGTAVVTAETVSFSEYGRRPTPADVARLFPFLPARP